MTSRRSTSFAAALIALVALSGCAADSTVSGMNSTIDTAPPSAPTNIREELNGAISVLAWDASTDADVVGYDVYQYSPDPARESAYIRLNASPIQSVEYSVTENADVNAWYRVKAVDLSGNRSASSGAAWVTGTSPTGAAPDLSDEPSIRR
jgi:penicillin-binding protein 1B